MTNNAHEDISILMDQDSTEYQDIKQRLKRNPEGEHLINILTLIEQMQSDFIATENEEIVNQSQLLKLSTEKNEHSAIFKVLLNKHTESLKIKPPLQDYENTDVILNDDDIAAIQAGNFDITFHRPSNDMSPALEDVLTDMLLFEVGRPSNYASTLSDLEKQDLIVIVKDRVKLTSLGKMLIERLQSKEPFIASKKFSKAFNAMTNSIASGLLPAEKALNALIKKCFHEQVDHVELWSELSDIYEVSNNNEQTVNLQSIIHKPKED